MPQLSRTADFDIEVPDGWTDRTMIAWSAPSSPSQPIPPNILIAYDKPRVGEGLAAYVDRQLKDLSGKAVAFRLDLKRDVTLSGRPAVEVVFCWDNNGTILKQRQLYSILSGGRVVSIVNTAREADFAAAEPQFLAILDSFAWNGPGGAAAPDEAAGSA